LAKKGRHPIRIFCQNNILQKYLSKIEEKIIEPENGGTKHVGCQVVSENLKIHKCTIIFFNICCGLQKEELKFIVKHGRTGTDLRL